MNGSDIIIDRIKADCDKRVNAIELDAKNKRESIMSEAQAEAQKLVSEIEEKTNRKLAQMEASSKSRCELESRNALLKRRRTEIDKTVDGLLEYFNTLDDNAYFEAIYKLCAQLKGKKGEILLGSRDLSRLPSDFEAQVKQRGLDATVSKSAADINSGFVLKSGDIEENMDFSAIIGARRDELEDLINRELFAK